MLSKTRPTSSGDAWTGNSPEALIVRQAPSGACNKPTLAEANTDLKSSRKQLRHRSIGHLSKVGSEDRHLSSDEASKLLTSAKRSWLPTRLASSSKSWSDDKERANVCVTAYSHQAKSALVDVNLGYRSSVSDLAQEPCRQKAVSLKNRREATYAELVQNLAHLHPS